jgi:hypothetical protein
MSSGLHQSRHAESAPSACDTRTDDSGFWNGTKSWYLFVLHLSTTIALVVGIIAIDGYVFKIGFGPNLFVVKDRLYQAQVTALISLALVIIRLIAGACSTLLAWRILSLLLERRGILLSEMTRLLNLRLPVLFGWDVRSWYWTIWAIIVTLLLWPQAFVAPLASSSITWLPQGQVVENATTSINIWSIGQYADYVKIFYPEWTMRTIITAAVFTGKEPIYAFNSTNLPLRRHFDPSQDTSDNSTIGIVMPYFAVDLRWIDATSDNRSQHAGNTTYQDVDKDFSIRQTGAIALVREQPWDPYLATPSLATTYRGTQLVAIKLQTLAFGDKQPDGTIANNMSKCLATDTETFKLPNVIQFQKSVFINDDDLIAYDCYLVAEATIVAGSYSAEGCIVGNDPGADDSYATCSVQRDDTKVQDHWLTGLSLDFMSEALKYTVLLNYAQPWISQDLDTYASGMLTLGYQAAFSAIIETLHNDKDTEAANFSTATGVIVASIDRPKLYIWLSMNVAMTLSAMMVYLAQRRSNKKTIRNPALSALTMDLSEVTHDQDAQGLCNAVTLSKQDNKLWELEWKENSGCHKLVLASTQGG